MKSYVLIVPVREFHNAKLRLRPFLTRDQRARLSLSLLNKVLTEGQSSKSSEILVVASSVDSAKRKIQHFSKVRVIAETNFHAGVNSAMNDGIRYARKTHPNASILLIPSDLPFLTFRSLDRVSSLLETYDLLINPSRNFDGTNLLAFNPDRARIRLHYDNNSFKMHLGEAVKSRINFRVLKSRSLSFDVDSIEDLTDLMRRLKATSHKELFARLEDDVR